jgi:hypothetical protein
MAENHSNISIFLNMCNILDNSAKPVMVNIMYGEKYRELCRSIPVQAQNIETYAGKTMLSGSFFAKA